MRRSILGLLALAGPILGAPPSEPATSTPTTAFGVRDDTAAALRGEFEDAVNQRALDEAKARGLVERALAVAKAARAKDERCDAWKLVLDVIGRARLSDDLTKEQRTALEGLCELSRDDAERLVPVISAHMGGDAFADLRADLLEKSKSGSVRAACLYVEAAATVANMRRNTLSEKERTAAVSKLERVRDEFGREKDHGRYGTWGEAVEGPLFQLQHLYVGAVAPDIVGEDLNGVEFKLSDYRGKVVVLDFWGNW